MALRRDLYWRAACTPEAPALETDDGVLSFAALAQRARRGAGFLHGTAVAPDDEAPVALLLPDGATFATWFHAAALAGRTALPLNLRLTAAELAQQLADARCTLLLAAQDDPRLGEIAVRVPGLAILVAPVPATLPEPSRPLPPIADDEHSVLAVLYTSGTTGRSKGACLTWGNFAASARAAEERFGAAVAGRWLACMPLFHVGGLSILVRSVLHGGPVRLHSRFDAAAVSAALDRGDVSGVSLVPTMLSRLLALRGARPAPAGLRVLLLGGAAAAPELVERALAAGYPVCPTYGLTEATSQVATASPPAPGATATGPMRPVLGTEVRIVADGRDMPAGQPGEIIVRGPTVMRGYLHAPEATARALRAGWLYTDDLGYLDAHGGLHVLDRRDDLVVSGGENVYPAEIEATLLEHPAVADVGVSGVADEDLGARIVAWVVVATGATVAATELLRHCRERLAGYKLPREFRFVDALPRSAAGKLLRRELKTLY
ncbi:MAG TPA: AMP-binding protein [Steroidobacteraceae bacterium]|nr:AMP-binding protein [Steroidobacteraceae bacterium]